MKPRAKIVYLFHSGYAVETQNNLFIFDYWQSGLPQAAGKLNEGIITADYLKTKANVYVFASHSHPDHYDPVIWEWSKYNSNLTYVLSSDIPVKGEPSRCQRMSPYEEWADGEVKVKTFSSTDEGVSFLVWADELTIFHAGDLNWWHWKGESQAERERAEMLFKTEVDKIAVHSLDIAFFPVDHRLEEFYSIGAEYFAAKLRPQILLPMHFGDEFGTSKAFAEKVGNSLSTVGITHRGQEFIYE
ncbi:MAG: hypothetical protein H6Q67_1877 [Firmicutes bacterium]|nr:hypothetical protein [Bacillota bacterium]